MSYKGFPTVDAYVAYLVFEQTRTEGDVTTYEVVDRLDPRQLETRIVHVGDSEAEAIALRDDLRRMYATRIDLRGIV